MKILDEVQILSKTTNCIVSKAKYILGVILGSISIYSIRKIATKMFIDIKIYHNLGYSQYFAFYSFVHKTALSGRS